MRTRALTVFVLAVATAGTTVAAAPAQAQEDSVTGTVAVTRQACSDLGNGFFQCFAPDRYHFDVRSGSSGEDPTGTVSFGTGERIGADFQIGPVTCLAVHGNRATIGVNFGSGSFMPPRAAIIFLEDNGGEGEDRIAVQDLPPDGAPTTCPADLSTGLAYGPTYPVSGPDWHVIVTDTQPPAPTSKDKCKNNGWRNYGDLFRTQGDCVSFVATGGNRGP